MTYRIVQAKPGTKVLDTLYPITPHIAGALRADGFEAVLRYTEIATVADLQACTGAGLGCFFATIGLSRATLMRYVESIALNADKTEFVELLQLLRTTPTAPLGARMGKSAVDKLASLGVPSGATIFSDLEGAAHTPGDWIDYGNAHAAAVHAGGHVPGGYFGGGIGLRSEEMYAMAMTRYGKGASRVQDRFGAYAEPACGWAWVQGFPIDILHASGIRIDVGALFSDYRGRNVSLVVAL